MIKIFRITFSYFIGLTLWFLCYELGVLFSVFKLQLSVENYIEIGFVAFISSLIGTYLAFIFMEIIHPSFEDIIGYLFIAIFAIFWIGSAILFETREHQVGEIQYKLVGLIMVQLGIFVTYKAKNFVLFS